MTEQELRDFSRRTRRLSFILSFAMAAAFVFFVGCTGLRSVDNGERIAVIESRLDRIETALNALVARKRQNGTGEATE